MHLTELEKQSVHALRSVREQRGKSNPLKRDLVHQWRSKMPTKKQNEGKNNASTFGRFPFFLRHPQHKRRDLRSDAGSLLETKKKKKPLGLTAPCSFLSGQWKGCWKRISPWTCFSFVRNTDLAGVVINTQFHREWEIFFLWGSPGRVFNRRRVRNKGVCRFLGNHDLGLIVHLGWCV